MHATSSTPLTPTEPAPGLPDSASRSPPPWAVAASLRPLRELWFDLLALLWPTACLACGAPDRDVCHRCLRQLRTSEPPPAPRLGRVPCFARGDYAGVLRALIIAVKHGGRVGLARELGGQLAIPLSAALEHAKGAGGPLIVAAPSRSARTRERGYRPVELLVRQALRQLRTPSSHEHPHLTNRAPHRPRSAPVSAGVPVPRHVRALRARRGRRGQVGLSPAERTRNAQLVAVRRRGRAALRGRAVVLVDDILTTGATLIAAQAALERAGARVVAIVVLSVVRASPNG